MKIIAMYLPQFHEIPENNMWWGKGFTEWTSVKSAKPLFKGHMQPRLPLHQNYYNLLDKSTILHQAELMKKYHVYGMCFYHYYFQHGRKLLEKPAENLLQWKDICMPFCFSWANETWARTWSRLSDKNSWNEVQEGISKNIEDDGVLVRQNYGSIHDWKLHFEYLLPFFKDERYIKIGNSPIFLIYKPDTIPCLSRMKNCWNFLAGKNGFNGIYLIGTNSFHMSCDAVLLQEPQYTISIYFNKKFQIEDMSVERKIEYDEICKKSVEISVIDKRPIFYSSFPGYDDTPRRGSAGMVVTDSSPILFENHLQNQIRKSISVNNDFLFINAWNEWGEGMYLEPDEKFGYGYLEAVKKVIESKKLYKEKKDNRLKHDIDHTVRMDEYINKKLDQYRSYWRILDKWLVLNENQKTISEYLYTNNYNRIAIYGLGLLGRHLVTDIQHNKSVRIQYGIDGKGRSLHFPFQVHTPYDELEEVDIIIVTVVHEYQAIEELLRGKLLKCPIVSLEEIIDEI